jgi:hypothetical protein
MMIMMREREKIKEGYGMVWLATFSLNVIQPTLLQWEDYVDTYIK